MFEFLLLKNNNLKSNLNTMYTQIKAFMTYLSATIIVANIDINS